MPARDGDFPGPVHRNFDPAEHDPVYYVVDTIAELERVSIEELPSTYDNIDGLVDRLYENPPRPETQATIEFSYAGYRVTLHQDGQATFLKIAGE
ncbi:MAG: HalOD1 output domain-containing protein [Haloarculaceae archaeon]